MNKKTLQQDLEALQERISDSPAVTSLVMERIKTFSRTPLPLQTQALRLGMFLAANLLIVSFLFLIGTLLLSHLQAKITTAPALTNVDLSMLRPVLPDRPPPLPFTIDWILGVSLFLRGGFQVFQYLLVFGFIIGLSTLQWPEPLLHQAKEGVV